MKKNKTILIIYVIVFCVGICFAYIMLTREIKKHKNAPVIDFANGVDIEVKDISFERNGLFLNGKEYNANGISGYSKFHYKDSYLELESINVPFILRKQKQNDTLKIIKDEKEMYLLVSKEIEYRKNGGFEINRY
ncbi:hypothetical protein [Flavobacterium cerinum]|uniref:Uncharacterized protein n=1 Tax=Flavobacterium cerinum TaxID=2502784 RepID=A0A3S4T0H6_9FLAO|nr:hypothetical protein [Flavobacterium cerinum]RWW99600.1 hypothetical protein EPI11_11645 [Flavobacterium cerinum]